MDKFIFDFDGVVIETEHIRFKTLKEILKEEGIIFKQELFSKFIGKKTASFLKEFFS